MPRKTLDYYIEKYGEEKGKKRYDGVQKAEKTKKEKYAKQPYARMTREWFIWKYGEEAGIEKYNSFSSKSAHTLENFIRLYGQEEGQKKYQETIKKKDTGSVESIMERNGCSLDEAIVIQKQIIDKRKQSISRTYGALSLEELEHKNKIKVEKSNRTKMERYGSTSNVDILKKKHPDNPDIVTQYKKKLFKTVPGEATGPCLYYIDMILEGIEVEKYQVYYGCKSRNLTEYKMYDHLANKGYSYDLTIIGENVKIIFEYDGAAFHASKKEYEEKPDECMPAVGKTMTYKESYLRDVRKRKYPEKKGFTVFIMRSDDDENTKKEIIHHIRSMLTC